MKIVADADGRILRIVQADDLSGTADAWSLEFDPSTNPTIAPAIAADHAGHRLLGGVLTRAGVPYVIAAEGEDEADRKAFAARAQQLRDYLALPSPNLAQTASTLKLLIRVVLYLSRRMVS